MSKLKKRNNRFKSFEGAKENDRHVRITQNMIKSSAWLDLKATSIKLYLAMKLRFNGTNMEIEFPYSVAEMYISKNIIMNCLDDLITHGFIEITFEGKPSRKANKYMFSAKWQKWPKIEVRQMSYKLFGSLKTEGSTTPKFEGSQNKNAAQIEVCKP